MKRLKNHRKKEKKKHIFLSILLKTLLVFAISTSSIVLYDMYVNIDTEEYDYSSERLSKEISAEDTLDISTTLEKSIKSVVRNIKNKCK